MRPLRLTMEAFGSYGKKTVIDFTELGERSFFLIHGRTGSGKTTLLDAICFAFYGEVSTKRRARRRRASTSSLLWERRSIMYAARRPTSARRRTARR